MTTAYTSSPSSNTGKSTSALTDECVLYAPNLRHGTAGACPWWIAGLMGVIVLLAVAFVIMSCHIKLLRRALFPFRDRVVYSPQENSPISSPRLSTSYTEQRFSDYRRTYLPPPRDVQ